MDNWDDLRFVVALARYGSMANAARHLRTNTATVSRRIKRLNQSTNSVLFRKGAMEWELTPDGRRLYEMAASFGDDLRSFNASTEETEQSFQTVRITGLEFLFQTVLSQSLKDFRAKNDTISLEMSATDRNVSLAYGEADIALRLARPREGRLVARRIADIKMGAFGRVGQVPRDWVGLPVELDWTPEMKNGLAHFGREPLYRMSSYMVILDAIEQTGLGGIAPIAMAAQSETIESLQDDREMPVRELWMVVHETRKSDPGIRRTCSWIEQSFSNYLT